MTGPAGFIGGSRPTLAGPFPLTRGWGLTPKPPLSGSYFKETLVEGSEWHYGCTFPTDPKLFCGKCWNCRPKHRRGGASFPGLAKGLSRTQCIQPPKHFYSFAVFVTPKRQTFEDRDVDCQSSSSAEVSFLAGDCSTVPCPIAVFAMDAIVYEIVSSGVGDTYERHVPILTYSCRCLIHFHHHLLLLLQRPVHGVGGRMLSYGRMPSPTSIRWNWVILAMD